MNVIDSIALCIELGKIDQTNPFPPDMKGQEGADELTRKALEQGYEPQEILDKGMIQAMEKVGEKFAQNKIFVPQMLMSAKAMTKAMEHLKPYFAEGSVAKKGDFVIGTVKGDMHDIGKNLVAIIVEGNGWNVIDLGVNVGADQFLEKLKEIPGCFIGLSAMLTSTMVNMEQIVQEIKQNYPDTKIIIGGAPVNQNFCKKIGADHYSPNPQDVIRFLNGI
jgi:5-methyltetrahydrofolate--homocysteine methyltransferase